MDATVNMQRLSTENLRKIEGAEEAEKAASAERDAAGAVDQMRRDKKEITAKIAEAAAQITKVD